MHQVMQNWRKDELPPTRRITSTVAGHLLVVSYYDVVGFHGASVVDLRAAFAEAVDDYLEACEKIKRSPQKPYSGYIMLRISPEIHSALAIAAEVSGKSINQWTADKLAEVLETNPQ